MSMMEIEQRRQQKRISRKKRLSRDHKEHVKTEEASHTHKIVPRKPEGKTCTQYGFMLCQPNGAPVLWTSTYKNAEVMLKAITSSPDGFQIVRAAMHAEYLEEGVNGKTA